MSEQPNHDDEVKRLFDEAASGEPADELPATQEAELDLTAEIAESANVAVPDAEPDWKQEAESWRHRYQSDVGRQNVYQQRLRDQQAEVLELKRQLEEMKQAPVEPDPPPEVAQEMDELRTLFPAFASWQDNQAKATREQLRKELEAAVTPLKQRELEAETERQAQEYQTKLTKLADVHPDWVDYGTKPELKKAYFDWAAQQPPALRNAAISNDPLDISFALSTFKRENTKPSVAEVRQRKLADAAGAATAAPPPQTVDNSDFNALWAAETARRERARRNANR